MRSQKRFFDVDNYGKINAIFDFEGSSCNYLNSSNFPQCFFEIVGLFAMDSKNHLRDISIINGNLSISGCYRGKKNELYLRFRYRHDCISLVVARVEFIHKRKGYMTKLYGILKSIQKQYKLKAIMIECVQTIEMKSWCEKNNFVVFPFYGGSDLCKGVNNSYIEKEYCNGNKVRR